MLSAARIRLRRDLREVEKNPAFGCSVAPKEGNFFVWEGVITGPQETPYEDGLFRLRITFPDDYPNRPPKVVFLSRMFHPNIYTDGRLCVDFLQNKWTSAYTVTSILVSIQSLLHDANPTEGANYEAARLYRNNHAEFVRRVHRTVYASLADGEEADHAYDSE
uniref:UBIQUITIN_CONJUGAT_2 domain-containing protein n=1 Tax=Steinernema glaseri TaxID=37863 RepID=A0A1I7ZI79_9BILA